MEKIHQHIDPTLLESFLDGELDEGRYGAVLEHVGRCPLCEKKLRGNKAIGGFLKEIITGEISRANLKRIEYEVLRRMVRKDVRLPREEFFAATRKIWMPVAVGVAAVFLFFVLRNPVSPPLLPSAVVHSLRGDVASMMIFETPRSRQTVLWFQEVSLADAEKNYDTNRQRDYDGAITVPQVKWFSDLGRHVAVLDNGRIDMNAKGGKRTV